nr:hypothetical protein [Tanacetum cinerariifolium]
MFQELEAKAAQYAVDRKHDAIELKNLLIANDNLIAECLSQEVFCVATNSKLNVARFTKMYVSNTTAEARCLALEAELANLRDTNNHDNQKELINHFSKLEVTKLTTKNVNLKTCVSKAMVNPQVSAREKHAIDVEPIVPRLRNNKDAHLDYLRHLKESVEIIRDIIEEAKVVNCSSLRFGHVLGCDLLENVLGCVLPDMFLVAICLKILVAFWSTKYLANVTKHRRFLAGETRSAQDSPTPKPAKPARKPKPTAQKHRINILQYLIHMRMCKDFPTKMMKMFLLVENLRQQNPNNHEMPSLHLPRIKLGILYYALRQEGSFATWKALLVNASEKETTDF